MHRYAATAAADIHVRTDNNTHQVRALTNDSFRNSERPAGDDDAGAVAGGEGDIAAGDAFGVAARGPDVEAAEDLAEHDPHLELRERCADAAAHAAAEGDPRVRRGWVLQEPLGPERVGLGVLLRARVGEPDGGRDVGPRRKLHA